MFHSCKSKRVDHLHLAILKCGRSCLAHEYVRCLGRGSGRLVDMRQAAVTPFFICASQNMKVLLYLQPTAAACLLTAITTKGWAIYYRSESFESLFMSGMLKSRGIYFNGNNNYLDDQNSLKFGYQLNGDKSCTNIHLIWLHLIYLFFSDLTRLCGYIHCSSGLRIGRASNKIHFCACKMIIYIYIFLKVKYQMQPSNVCVACYQVQAAFIDYLPLEGSIATLDIWTASQNSLFIIPTFARRGQNFNSLIEIKIKISVHKHVLFIL